MALTCLWPAHVPDGTKVETSGATKQSVRPPGMRDNARAKVRVVRLWFEYFIPVGDFRSEGASSFNAENSCEEFVE